MYLLCSFPVQAVEVTTTGTKVEAQKPVACMLVTNVPTNPANSLVARIANHAQGIVTQTVASTATSSSPQVVMPPGVTVVKPER